MFSPFSLSGKVFHQKDYLVRLAWVSSVTFFSYDVARLRKQATWPVTCMLNKRRLSMLPRLLATRSVDKRCAVLDGRGWHVHSSCTICSDSNVALATDARSFAKTALTIRIECKDDCIHKFIMLSSRNRNQIHSFFSQNWPKPTAYKILRTVTTLHRETKLHPHMIH